MSTITPGPKRGYGSNCRGVIGGPRGTGDGMHLVVINGACQWSADGFNVSSGIIVHYAACELCRLAKTPCGVMVGALSVYW